MVDYKEVYTPVRAEFVRQLTARVLADGIPTTANIAWHLDLYLDVIAQDIRKVDKRLNAFAAELAIAEGYGRDLFPNHIALVSKVINDLTVQANGQA